MAHDDDDRPDRPRAFASFLAELEDGGFHHHLSGELHALVARLCDHATENGGKAAGKLKLEIDLDVDGALVTARARVATTYPAAKRGRSVFWVTPENNLTRHNPRQQDLPLRDVTSAGGDRPRSVV